MRLDSLDLQSPKGLVKDAPSASVPKAYRDRLVDFMGLRLMVDERVYVPTPETGALVDHAMAYLRALGVREPTVIDVGTGCGNIAIKISQSFPDARVIASDISADALDMAAANGRLHARQNVEWCIGNLVDEVPDCAPDLIVANLPWGSPEYLLKSHTLEELNHMPPIAIFPRRGLVGAYVDLVSSVTSRGWQTVAFCETGVLPEHKVREEMPASVAWSYRAMSDYSITELWTTPCTTPDD
jgi:release factor glutamine methyltransferase